MDETQVPAHPVVEIEVSAEAVTVDGVVVDRGSAGGPDTTVAMHLGVHAAARQVAQPLARPVRAILRCGADEKRMVIHPDGTVSNVEDTFPVVSLVAPAGSRGAPIARHARRVKVAALRAYRAKLMMGAAYLAVGAVLVGGILVEASGDDRPSEANGAREDLAVPATGSAQAIVAGTRLERLPGVRNVVVTPDTGGFRVRVTTGRAGRVTVLAARVSGDGEARLWTIRTGKATTRTLVVDDLEAAVYRWTVRSPGERPVTGRVVVRPTPEPPSVVTVGSSTEPAPSPAPDGDGDGTSRGGDGGDAGSGDGDSTLVGPTRPVDPDDPMAR
jgi:hypothetical protein